MSPFLILAVGVCIVVGMIIVFRSNAFIALLLAALVVSFMAAFNERLSFEWTLYLQKVFGETAKNDFEWFQCVQRVAHEFGSMAGRVGIVIAMGSIIGKCMMESGAADRIVLSLSRLFGEKRMSGALITSGFVLSIPVFYDSTFYLLVPLARSIYRRVRKNYILFLTTIGAGATISHTLVPPTPGPLTVAGTLDVPIGTMMLIGGLVGACLCPIALLICYFVNWLVPFPEIADMPETEEIISEEERKKRESQLPGFWLAMLPIIIPVLLIASQSFVSMWENARIGEWNEKAKIEVLERGYASARPDLDFPGRSVLQVLGQAEIALALAALVSALVLIRMKSWTLKELNRGLEDTLSNAGFLILITSAGGAFGKMLQIAEIGPAITDLFRTDGHLSGTMMLILAFVISALIKTAQGSSTTAMVTTAGIVAGLQLSSGELGFNLVYIGTAIGLGSIVTGWMNDSGFWLFCRMGGISEQTALKTWTVLLALMGTAGLGIVLILSRILPLS